MTISRVSHCLLFGAVILAGCGDGSGPDNRAVDCTEVTPTVLGVGEHVIVNAAQLGCVQLPPAGPDGAEHLYVALSGQGAELRDGATADYSLTAGPPAVAAEGPRLQVSRAGPRPTEAVRFHDRLRRRERELVASSGGVEPEKARVEAAKVPPTLGHTRTFKVCETASCQEFVDVTATARVVGQRVAIYLDEEVPAGGYTPLDLERVGDLFGTHLYPIDTVAFGRESDLDGNDVVIVLLTDRVNRLIPNCNASGSVVAGYFFGLDLLPSRPNSNAGEVFYGLVPDPDNPSCTISREFAVEVIPVVFAHEFSHMIGFNQSVLVRRATTVEQTWLDEGLAHFAEELAGRQVPDAECQPLYDSCESQFLAGNFANGYLYLDDPEESFLIEPDTSSGDLAERGANWLFVRWLADHHASSQPLGTQVTRALVQTTRRGSANVEAVTGESFDDLVARWQLANYLEDLPGFAPDDATLQYTSWAFRELYQANFDEGNFDKPYPLTPDSTSLTGAYTRTGTLRGGSGRHLRIIQSASAAPVTVRLTRSDGATALGSEAQPRVALIRIR